MAKLRGGSAHTRTEKQIVTRVVLRGFKRFTSSGSQVGRSFSDYGRRSIVELLSPRVGILERGSTVLMTNSILIGP